MKSYRVKFIAMTLAVGILFTSVMAYASTETADVNAYKDYIAMELNAELFDSMGAENGVFPEEYAGAYIDDSGNYHVVVGGICYFMPAAAPETVIALGFV